MRRVLVLALLLALAQPAAAAPGDIALVAAPDGPGTDGDSISPSISPDGRFVAFVSSDEDLSSSDPPGQDVFLRDMASGAVTIFGPGIAPAVSADGEFVAYENAGTVHWRGVHGGAESVAGNDPSISADGRFVAYESGGAVSRRDFQQATTAAVATGSNPSISADGRFIAFEFAGSVFRRDVSAGTTLTIAAGTEPSISADGNRVAFESTSALVPGDDNFSSDVFVFDVAAGSMHLASRGEGAGGAVGDSGSENAAIAPDGSAVAFQSTATNFVLGEGFGTHVFVRDLPFESITLASRAQGVSGTPADDQSRNPSLGDFGLNVAFESDADNLSASDDNGFTNVFRREVGGPPVNVAAPVIAQAADLLSCSGGSWRWPVASLAFTWLRDGAPVAGGAEYRPGAADAGSAFVCEVTAANGAGATAARSAAVGLAAAPSGLLVLGVQVTSPFAALRESFNGTRRRDRLIGSVRANTIRGRAGNDLILGGGGNDRLYGDAGRDTIDGETGNDLVDGGTGNDRLTGGDGRDRVKGGAGADRINVRDGARDTVDCGKGRDRVTADRKDRLKGCERVKRR